MKRLLSIVFILAIVLNLASLSVSKSLMYSGSYMLRSKGAGALYWNPALLNPGYQDIILPLANTSVYVSNNAFDLDTYNFIVGNAFLDESEKQKILDKIDQRLTVQTEAHTSLYGETFGSWALASSFHVYGKSSLSKKYLDLLLHGNTSEEYTFHKRNNNLAAVSFIDLTVGKGNMLIPKFAEGMPEIRYGFSGSLLFGTAGVNTKSYDGFFSSNLDGLNVNQDITLGTGFAGGGFKANLGLASEVFPGMHLGMTVDNILGFISWGAVTEDLHYNVRIDSVYVSNLEDDLYVESHETNDSGNWKTKLPIEIKMSALYQLPRANISLDWVQGTDNSLFTSKISRWSMGSELELTKNIPIHLGVAFGNSESPWRMSYGIGLKTKISEFGIGFQTYESMFPGLGSKGVSLATYMNLRM